ncbi:Fe2+-enterobactin ABC transporter substrate-binding protein [Pseudomonas silvicola]|nr:Fe2+-enterobactin ABC transporter substrate-binding protein [Pseudomonas silvicola]
MTLRLPFPSLRAGLCLLAACLPLLAHADASWPRTVSGEHGSVVLDHAPKRIVSTSVTLTGALLAIDAPVVASGATVPNNRVADDQGYLRQWGAIAKARNVQRLYIGEANAESVAMAAPDLILISATGGDSAMALYDQLSAIAPTLVVNYDDKSWQDVERLLGQATGHEGQAQALIKAFADRQAQVRKDLTLPPQPVSAFVYNPAARQANVWTRESSQGQLLEQLGFQLASPSPAVASNQTMGKRKDIIQAGGEHMADALTGQTFLMFAAEPADTQAVLGNTLLAHLPAVGSQRVYALGTDTFRLDYYSASHLLDRLQAQFGKPGTQAPAATASN